MIEQIDFKTTAVVPMYEQIAAELKKNIVSGLLSDGVKLPSEPELAQQFGVSRPTLRKSLKRLEEQNLIRQRKGCGTFVAYRKIPPKRVALIGVDIRNNFNFYNSQILSGLSSALQNNEILFMNNLKENSILDKYHGSECDGIICLSDYDAVLNELLKPKFKNIPMVFLNCRKPAIREGYHACVSANPKALEIAVEHLVKLGHRDVAYIAASSRYSDLKLRNDEFIEARAKYGLNDSPSLYLEYKDKVAPWYDQSRQIARELCSRKKRPTAIICSIACNAYGAWQGIMDSGLRIPEDISIIGFDCENYFNPYLSTIEQPVIEMSETAGELMLDMLNKNRIIKKELIFGVKLEDRGSCAALPA